MKPNNYSVMANGLGSHVVDRGFRCLCGHELDLKLSYMPDDFTEVRCEQCKHLYMNIVHEWVSQHLYAIDPFVGDIADHLISAFSDLARGAEILVVKWSDDEKREPLANYVFEYQAGDGMVEPIPVLHLGLQTPSGVLQVRAAQIPIADGQIRIMGRID